MSKPCLECAARISKAHQESLKTVCYLCGRRSQGQSGRRRPNLCAECFFIVQGRRLNLEMAGITWSWHQTALDALKDSSTKLQVKRVPIELYKAFTAKCKAEKVSRRAKIIELISAWTEW